MNQTALKKEIHGYIEAIPEYRLEILKPLLADLAEPLYTIETDLTEEEIAIIDEGMAEYRANPSSFITLAELKKRRQERKVKA